MKSLNRFVDPVYCIARLIVGLMFACHGGQKILGFPSPAHAGALDTLGLIGAWIELAGGFLIAFGLITRIAAFFSAGEMAVAYFMVHHKWEAFFPITNKGELAVLYCWFFLLVLFYGPGRWSIDAILRKKSGSTAPTG
jgi:putative oxidoreductase